MDTADIFEGPGARSITIDKADPRFGWVKTGRRAKVDGNEIPDPNWFRVRRDCQHWVKPGASNCRHDCEWDS